MIESKGLGFDAYRLEKFGLEGDAPVSFAHVAQFLSRQVINRGGSTRSLTNDMWQLSTYWAQRQRAGWLDAEATKQLKEVVLQFRLMDMSEGRQKSPLTMDIIEDIAAVSNTENWQVDCFITMIFLGNQGLLRGGELCSGLRMKDLRVGANGESISILLRRTKTVRSGPGVWLTIPDNEGPSAVKMVLKWIARRGLKADSDQRLFPKQANADWLRKAIKNAVRRIGLDPKRFANHSLRAGGATDLFVARVPYSAIKKAGRWKSDAAMLYYRSEDDVQAAVKEGRNRLRASRVRYNGGQALLAHPDTFASRL